MLTILFPYSTCYVDFQQQFDHVGLLLSVNAFNLEKSVVLLASKEIKQSCTG